jgi:hypothetical protein
LLIQQIIIFQNDDIRMHEIMRFAHQFLQSFCLKNQQNQALLHQNLELFMTPGVRLYYNLYYFSLQYYSLLISVISFQDFYHSEINMTGIFCSCTYLVIIMYLFQPLFIILLYPNTGTF